MLGSCKKDTGEQSASASTTNNKEKNVATTSVLGSGWVEYTVARDIHLEELDGYHENFPWSSYEAISTGTLDYRYTSTDNTHTFRIIKNDGKRSEIRLRNDYNEGSRQFEGYVTFNAPVNDQCLMQIWGSTDGATQMMVRAYDDNNGTIRIGTSTKSNLYGKEVKVNVIHLQEDKGNKIIVYLDDVKFYERADNENVTNYWKYGVYGNSYVSANVKWRNVRIFRDGTAPSTTTPTTTYYKIKVLNNTNYVLNSASSSPVDGTNVNVYTSGSSDAQLWRVITTDNGYVRIVPKSNANLVLAPTTATFSNGVNVELDTWGSYNRQQWLISPLNNGTGASKISARLNSAYALDCSTTPANGTNVQLWTYSSSGTNTRQQWIVEPVN
jgi:hypothetical protein